MIKDLNVVVDISISESGAVEYGRIHVSVGEIRDMTPEEIEHAKREREIKQENRQRDRKR